MVLARGYCLLLRSNVPDQKLWTLLTTPTMRQSSRSLASSPDRHSSSTRSAGWPETERSSRPENGSLVPPPVGSTPSSSATIRTINPSPPPPTATPRPPPPIPRRSPTCEGSSLAPRRNRIEDGFASKMLRTKPRNRRRDDDRDVRPDRDRGRLGRSRRCGTRGEGARRPRRDDRARTLGRKLPERRLPPDEGLPCRGRARSRHRHAGRPTRDRGRARAHRPRARRGVQGLRPFDPGAVARTAGEGRLR